MKAVIFIDVQNDFITGPLAVPGATEKVDYLIQYAKECRNKGYSIYATVDTHDEKYKETLEGHRIPVHCIKGTYGHQIIDGLVKDEDLNVIIPQGHICDKSIFGSSDLVEKLEEDFIYPRRSYKMDENSQEILMGDIGEPLDEIVLCGFCTSICIISNALLIRTKFPNVKISIVEKLCGDINEESHKAALTVAKNCMIDII